MGKNIWLQESSEDKYKIWAGYAFENLCIKHAEAIKMALGISGIYTETSSFSHKSNEQAAGFQLYFTALDFVQMINLTESGFHFKILGRFLQSS